MCDLATRGTVACDTLILEDVPARIEQEGTTGATQTTNPPPNNAALASQLPAITARETCFFFCFLFFVFFIFPFFSCSIAPPFRSKKRSTVETPLEIRPHEIKQEHPTINESTFMNFILFYRINSYFSRQEQKVRNLIGPFKTKQTHQQFPTQKKTPCPLPFVGEWHGRTIQSNRRPKLFQRSNQSCQRCTENKRKTNETDLQRMQSRSRVEIAAAKRQRRSPLRWRTVPIKQIITT